MYRFLLTPRWWGINLFAVLALPVCLLMGGWQLGRFEARIDSHRSMAERTRSSAETGGQRADAVPLGRLLPVDQRTSGRRASVTGRYDRAHQMLVPHRVLDGRRGFYVLTPLRVDEGGPALPVVRGWLPGGPDPDRVPAPPDGTVTVIGALQASEHRDSAGAHRGGGLPPGQLGIISAATLVNLVPYDVHDAWITLPETTPPLRPVPPSAPTGTGLDAKAFQNLGYTAEWFVFAGFVLFMWYRLFRREVEAAQDRALGLDPHPGGDDGLGPRPSAETASPVSRAGTAERTGSPAGSA